MSMRHAGLVAYSGYFSSAFLADLAGLDSCWVFVVRYTRNILPHFLELCLCKFACFHLGSSPIDHRVLPLDTHTVPGAVCYIRVPTAAQEAQTYNLPTQTRKVEDRCNRDALPILKTFTGCHENFSVVLRVSGRFPK